MPTISIQPDRKKRKSRSAWTNSTGAHSLYMVCGVCSTITFGCFLFNGGLNIIDRLAGKDDITVSIITGILTLVIALTCGINGNKKAWNKVDNMTPERFDQKQHRWNVAGIICFVFVIVIILLCIVLEINNVL